VINPWSNKRPSYLGFHLLLLIVVSVVAYAADSVKWTGIKERYAAYCELPSDENAEAVIELLPTALAAYATDKQKNTESGVHLQQLSDARKAGNFP
jgi:hypothetical protein